MAGVIQAYEPARNAECLCGSGKKFKRCCADRYNDERPFKKTISLFNNKRYEEALIQCRADITRYTIWHRAHTEAPINIGVDGLEGLLFTDIMALSYFVDLLLKCYDKNNRLDDFPAVLERLRGNIKHDKWRQRIIYYHALCALLPNWNVNSGRQELRKIGRIVNIDFADIIQLYLDLFGESLSFAKQIQAIDKAIALSEMWVDRLQYKTLKAIQYYLINDAEEAQTMLAEAIDEARQFIKGTVEPYEALIFGSSVDLLSSLNQDESLVDESIIFFKTALESDFWNQNGVAEIHRRIGDAYKIKENWDLACSHYETNIELAPDSVSRIYLSECYINTGDIAKAGEALKLVNTDKLDYSGYIDYVFIYGKYSIAKGGNARLIKAVKLLKECKISQPIFEQRKQELIVSILECIANGKTEYLLKRASFNLKDILRAVNRYLMIKPNIMGLGVNINNAIRDSIEIHSGKEEKK